jgi:hypothetical protein
LTDLHAQYKAQKAIRPLFNPISDKAALVRRLVQFNNIEGALEKLDNYASGFDQDDRNMITILKSSYRDWQDHSNGNERTRSTEDLLLQLNRIRKAILDITSKLS